MIDDSLLLRQLGRRLDHERKLEFLRAAKDTVARFNAARDANKQRTPTPEDYEALEDVRSRAQKLSESLARASRLGLPADYLREVWAYRSKHRSNVVGPQSKDFPDFDELLSQLAQCALWFMEDRKPAHRPIETWSHAAVIVTFLASKYYNLFGRPGVGTGSPFVKFCVEFLPASGLDCPSLDTLKKIVDRTLGPKSR